MWGRTPACRLWRMEGVKGQTCDAEDMFMWNMSPQMCHPRSCTTDKNAHTLLIILSLTLSRRRSSALNVEFCFCLTSVRFCLLNSVFQKSSGADGGEAKTNIRKRAGPSEWEKKRGAGGSSSPAFLPSNCGDEPQMFTDRRSAVSNSWSGIRFELTAWMTSCNAEIC